jgi:hypothetical protein
MTGWKATSSSDDHLSSVIDESPEQMGDIQSGMKTGTQIETIVSSPKKLDIDPLGEPPDGGLNAWLKVLGCFLIYSNIW